MHTQLITRVIVKDGKSYSVSLLADLTQLANYLGHRALRNKSRKSSEMGGLVVASVREIRS